MKVSEISYDVDGWGRGTLWFDDAVLVWHELPSPHPDASSSGAPQPTTHCDSIVENRTSVRPDRADSVTISQPVVARLQGYFAGERLFACFPLARKETDLWIRLSPTDQSRALREPGVRPHRRFARRGWIELDLVDDADVPRALRWLRRAHTADLPAEEAD